MICTSVKTVEIIFKQNSIIENNLDCVINGKVELLCVSIIAIC